MWRSFFLAVGISLMLLGVEALVFERFVVNQTAKLPKFLNGIFEKDLAGNFARTNNLPGQADPAFRNPTFQNPSFQTSNASNFQRVPFSSESRFGPSRFSGPQAGNYGGGRVDLSRSGINSNNPQSGAAFPVAFANRANPAVAGGGIGSFGQTRGPRTIVTKDWMPWSLLAAGAIIFLYTSSYGRSRSEY